LESFSFGPRGLAGHLEQDRLQFEIELDIELSGRSVQRVEKQIADMRSGNGVDGKGGGYVKERLLRYRLRVEILPRSGIVRVADEYLAALRDDGQLKASRKPFIERMESRLRLRLEGQAHPTDHEIGLDHTLVSRPLYRPHYPHIAAFRQELSDWAFFYFEPRETPRDGVRPRRRGDPGLGRRRGRRKLQRIHRKARRGGPARRQYAEGSPRRSNCRAACRALALD
jgi:hypothetical protein